MKGINGHTVPYRHQLWAVRRIEQFNGRALCSLPMGGGKTYVALLRALRCPEARPMVIVCPASLKVQWEREANTHAGLRAEILEGTKPKGVGLIGKKIVIINYDILHAWVDALRAIKPRMIVLDEAHFLLSLSSRRTKATRKLCKGVPQVLALTGTPILNRPIELFPVLNILRPDLWPNLYPFAHRFCAPKRTYWGWDFTGASNLPELHDTLEKTVLVRKTREEILANLPEKRRIVLPVALSKRREYVKAETDFIRWIRDNAPDKEHKVQYAETLMKIGYLRRLLGELKLPAVMEWVESFLAESDGKLLLFAIHQKIIQALRGRFKKCSVTVDGSVTGKRRQQAVDQFQRHDSTRLFIGNIRAAGVGLNLHAAHTVAFAELDWTPGAMTQAEDRCYARLANLHGASVWYMIGTETIEEHMLKIIQRKQRVLSTVLDGDGEGEVLDVHDQLLALLKTGDLTHGL